MGEERRRLQRLIDSSPVSPRVAAAFGEVDRAEFVPGRRRRGAYRDRPIALPEGQTTSQPSLIALMIDAAAIGADDRVLEVGGGYGFQTAILARLADTVVSVERLASLAAAARDNLARAGIGNAEVAVGDGWQGFSAAAPYDAVIVAAAAVEVPPAFAEQIREGGRLVIPVAGPTGDDVYLFVKGSDGLVLRRLITPARFVPLVRERDVREQT